MEFESNQEDRPLGGLQKYQHWDERHIKISWHHDWYDGPIDGVIVYQGGRYWFSFYCDTDAPGNPFYYLVYPLTVEEADSADAWSVKSEDYAKRWRPLANNPASRDLSSTKALGEEWKRHFETLPDFAKREAIAWFQSGANQSFYGIEIERAK